MSKRMKYGIVCLLLLGVGAILYFSGNYTDDPYAKKEINVDEIRWEKDYDSQSNHPYGSYFLHELIDRGFEDYKLRNLNHSVGDYFQHDSLKVNADVLNYFFIGKKLKLYNDEVDSLLAFAKRGNNIFIAAEFFPRTLIKALIKQNYHDYIIEVSDTAITLSFIDPQYANVNYELTNVINGNNIERRWRLWTPSNYTTNYQKNIGKGNYAACYTKITFGKGIILLHTIPQAFTNQFLKSKTGREYVETALSYLPKGTVLWDNYTQFVIDDGSLEIDEGQNDQSKTGEKINTKSMISFLMKSPQLRWAYLIILCGMLLFIVFMGKRRQKVIPTVLSNINTSIEFTETISRIYRSKGQHNKLIKHMEIVFKNKMKTRYFIKYVDDNSYAERISKKSGISEKEIKILLNLFKTGTRLEEISDFFLVNLYKKLQLFYKKAR